MFVFSNKIIFSRQKAACVPHQSVSTMTTVLILQGMDAVGSSLWFLFDREWMSVISRRFQLSNVQFTFTKRRERNPHPVLLVFYWLVSILSCTCLGCSGARGTWPIGHPSPAIWTKVHYKVTVDWYLVDLVVFCYSVCCSCCHNKPRLISARRRVQGC